MKIRSFFNAIMLLTICLLFIGTNLAYTQQEEPISKGPVLMSSKELSDEELLEYYKSPFDKEKMMFKDMIIGKHKGIPVRVTFPCGDICPDYTIKVVRYDIELSQCEQAGGLVRTIFVPSAAMVMPEEFCFPKIIVENSIDKEFFQNSDFKEQKKISFKDTGYK